MAVMTFDIDRDRRDIDVSEQIAKLVPDDSPFTAILMRAKKKPTNTAEFIWYEEEPGAYWTKVNYASGYDDSATSIVVDDASIFAPKDVVKVASTGEVMFVTAVNTTTNTITVVRGYGTTSAASIADDSWLVKIGNALEENSSAPEAKVAQPSKQYNYTQIFRTVFDGSYTSDAESLKTAESERNRLRRIKALEHRMAMERAFLFGERKEDVANKRRMTGGILNFIKTNVYVDANGTLTEAEFEAFCEMLFTYGSSRKLLICAPHVLTVINQFAHDKLKVEVGENTYGVRITKYMSTHGDLNIVVSKALEKEYANMAIGLDMDYVFYRPLAGRDTKLRTNIQSPDKDGWVDEYITEAGIEIQLEKAHAILKNVLN